MYFSAMSPTWRNLFIPPSRKSSRVHLCSLQKNIFCFNSMISVFFCFFLSFYFLWFFNLERWKRVRSCVSRWRRVKKFLKNAFKRVFVSMLVGQWAYHALANTDDILWSNLKGGHTREEAMEALKGSKLRHSFSNCWFFTNLLWALHVLFIYNENGIRQQWYQEYLEACK